MWADCKCHRIFHIKPFKVLVFFSLTECTHIVGVAVTLSLAWMSLVKATSVHICEERFPIVCVGLHLADLCPAPWPQSLPHPALSIPWFRLSSWFLENTNSTSTYSLFGALIWPGDRAAPWLQAGHCPGAASDQGVCLLLGREVDLWLSRVLSNQRDERVTVLWNTDTVFITYSPHWQLCVN